MSYFDIEFMVIIGGLVRHIRRPLVSHELSELVFLLLIIRLDFPDSAGLWLQSLANELVMGGTVFVKGRSNIVALLAVRVEPRSIGS